MKSLIALLIFAGMAAGQTPGKIITFNQADTEHCKVIIASGKPLLQSTYEDTSVAIAMPVNRGNGDFSVFVTVSRSGSGTIQVNPKDFYGLYSDKDHTRFQFYDKAAELESARAQSANNAISATNSQIDPRSIRPGAIEGRGPPPAGGPDSGEPPLAGSASMSDAYFPKGKVKQGSGIAGWITLRQPNGGRLEVHPTDMLDEVDIPVNGILFRF